MKNIFPFKFKSSLGYLFYNLAISFAFMCIILISYFTNNLALKIVFSFLLSLLILGTIFNILSVFNKKMKWYNYLIIGLSSVVVLFGLLYIGDLLTHHTWLAIFMFTLSAYTLAWIIYKLVICIKDVNEHFCILSFTSIFLVFCITLGAGMYHVYNNKNKQYIPTIAELIKEDVSSNLSLADNSLKEITFLSYDKTASNLYVGVLDESNNNSLYSYSIPNKMNLDEALLEIYALNEMPDFELLDLAKSEDDLLKDINMPIDFINTKFLSKLNFKDKNNISYTIGMFSTTATNLGRRITCPYWISNNNIDFDFKISSELAEGVINLLLSV